MTDLKYGLIGCGMMGVEHVRNVALVDGARIAAVYDPVPDLAERAAAIAGGADICASLEALIRYPGLDAFVICSPNHHHVSQIEAIAARRPLPILCEKPLYTRPEDEGRIAALARDFPHPIWVAMEYRYMPPIAELVAQADTITGGVKMLTIREHRIPFLKKVGDWNRFNENTGGTFVEKCCHFFDLMRLIVRSEPVRVMASASQITNYKDESYDGRTPDIWDGGYAIFDFENGARAMLELCMFADGTLWNEEICAVGPVGKIESRIPGPQRFWPDALGAPPEPEISTYPRHPKNPQTRILHLDPKLLKVGDHHGSTYHQHVRFAETVRCATRPEVTLEDGAKAVRMALAAQQAAIEHRTVTFG